MHEMKALAPYVGQLESLLASFMGEANGSKLRKTLGPVLDGQPSKKLRHLVPVEELRAAGAFFTGSALAKLSVHRMLRTVGLSSVIVDPACGAGDLLIACTRGLPVAAELVTTLSRWGDCIVGRDIYPEFVRAAKARLALEAIRRGASAEGASPLVLDDLFPEIRCRSALGDGQCFAGASHIVLNPPFSMTNAPRGCRWASGTVSSAAVFLEHCLDNARNGSKIVAILPDVLRSGSRYAKWRELVESQTRIRKVRIVGQFANWADVDVFTLEADIHRGDIRKHSTNWHYPQQGTGERLSDRFDISVGPVVSYRDPHRGPWAPFLCARDLPSWTIVRSIEKNRRFSGRVVPPPFVVVRRTSRPGDRHRAIGTIVAGKKPVAVENHLLVLRPRDGTLRQCRSLIAALRRSEVSDWLDRRIRCRHLTVAALRELPWWSDVK